VEVRDRGRDELSRRAVVFKLTWLRGPGLSRDNRSSDHDVISHIPTIRTHNLDKCTIMLMLPLYRHMHTGTPCN
jgi:hypothetical protein